MADQAVQFRDQVVVSNGHEARVLLWIKQDPRVIRCGLAVPGADLHYSGYTSEPPHLTGKAKEGMEFPAVIAMGPLQLSPEPTVAEMLCSYTFVDIDDDWSRFQLFEHGKAANLLFLERGSLSPCFRVNVDVADLRNFFPSYSQFDTAQVVLLDVSASPLIALSVHDAEGS